MSTLTTLCTFVDGLTAAPVWANTLPAGFDNTAAAVVVSVLSDTRHQSGADRDVRFDLRAYGGSPKSSDSGTFGEILMAGLTNASTHTLAIQRIGEVVGQELPPEIDTGYPSFRITARARINNDTIGT